MERTNRSAKALAFGAWTGVITIRTPAPWAKWVELGLGYYSTTARQWIRAVKEPEKRPEHVQKMIEEFKTHLVSLAQVPGQAVLSFNQTVEELLREPTPDPAGGSPAERALGRKVIEGFERLSRSAAFQTAARQAGLTLPDVRSLETALSKLEQAQGDVLLARREVHGAVEAVLQVARQLAGDLEKAEEPPVDVLRRLAGDLERINASVAPKTKQGG
jgi:hypothetical protein